MFILISMSESINTHTAKTFWQMLFWIGPPRKQHPAQKSFFGGEKVIWSWCFWPYGAGAGLKGMQDTHGPGKEIAQSQCRRCCIIMSILFIYVYIYILKRFKAQNPQNLGTSKKFWLKTMHVPYYVLILKKNKKHFWEAHKGYPLGGLPPPNNVHVRPQLKRPSALAINWCQRNINWK